MMKFKRSLLFILVIFSLVLLAACDLPASTKPEEPTGEAGDYPVPGGTLGPMEVLSATATQEALEASRGQSAEPGTSADEATQAVEEPVQTPTVGEAQPAGDATAQPAEGGTDVTGGAPGSDAEAGGGQAVPANVQTVYEVPDTYVLQSGEFPYCIARRFNISVSALMSANGLSASSTYTPGTVLVIPKDAGPFDSGPRALLAHPAQHTVLAGQTANSIACLYGDVDPRAIIAANGLAAGTALSAGQVIQIP